MRFLNRDASRGFISQTTQGRRAIGWGLGGWPARLLGPPVDRGLITNQLSTALPRGWRSELRDCTEWGLHVDVRNADTSLTSQARSSRRLVEQHSTEGVHTGSILTGSFDGWT